MSNKNDNSEYISEEKKKELEKELANLIGPKRKEILESLEYAKSLGDLSENAEYQQAREEQAKLETRVSQIEHFLKSSTIVTKHHSDKVEVGSTVIVQKEGTKDKKTYQIVGAEEVDMLQGKISTRSPLGEALMGNKKGDTISFESPKGVVKYKIVDIE
ncbi:MAG: transcription elongation factor GreA [Candidatus Paceibacterota bacterium]|jgi:transcription elongation factor GreA